MCQGQISRSAVCFKCVTVTQSGRLPVTRTWGNHHQGGDRNRHSCNDCHSGHQYLHRKSVHCSYPDPGYSGPQLLLRLPSQPLPLPPPPSHLHPIPPPPYNHPLTPTPPPSSLSTISYMINVTVSTISLVYLCTRTGHLHYSSQIAPA